MESDPLGLAASPLSALSTYSYAGDSPVMYRDPSGLILPDVTKLMEWMNPPPLSREECDKLRRGIYLKNALLRDELSAYDPVLDGQGGFRMAYGSGVTKPGGHYQEIRDLQRGLKKDLKKYNQRCRNDDNSSCPPITRNVDELANSPVESPVYPFFLPPSGVGPGVGVPVGGGALSPVFVP